MTTFPNAPVLPIGADGLLTGEDAHTWYTSPDGNSRFFLEGPLAPWPGIQDGAIIPGGLKPLSPDFQQIALKSARQPGSTWTGTVWDEMNTDIPIQLHARTPQGISALISEWMGAWPPDKTGVLEHITPDRGYWYCNVRRAKAWPDAIKKAPRTVKMLALTHSITNNDAFWFGFPSISSFQPGGTGGSGFVQLTNIGDQHAYPTVLFYGPGTLGFSNGDSLGTSTMITFGPLEAGQVVLIDTRQRLRQVIDLSPGAPAPQSLNSVQKLVEQITNFVTNNNVPPLLQQFESLFGILPPQGALYSLLNGHYANPIPGVAQPQWAKTVNLKVSITGGNSASKAVFRIDPMRVWPE
ncbi:hypothetical protein C1Y40_04641 [Mycobacterium talmoniae]|uniref:Minor tail protein n=1 Tax=Mycobacterium talmoniae TaxID=1858794 RepID=A0A2S8BF16_9MYCO|nr:hypothetical protein C1Y40_04641 [Mycobacterium talmoniae]